MVAVISKIVYSSIAIVMTSILSAIPIHSLTSLARKFWAFGFVWYCPSISYTESTLNKDHTGCWSFACSPPFFLKICPVLIQASETANNDVYIQLYSTNIQSVAKWFSQTLFYFCLSCTCVFLFPRFNTNILRTNQNRDKNNKCTASWEIWHISLIWWCVVYSLSSGFSVLKIRPISSNNSEGFWKHGV